MKHLTGIIGAIIALILLIFINYIADRVGITTNQFIISFTCCVGYFVGVDIYEEFKS